MSTPRVTGFSAEANLGNNQKGLNSKNNSVSPVTLSGDNLSNTGMTVNVSNGAGVSWSGSLFQAANVWRANLTCSNYSEGSGDSEDVTVTVTSQDGTSPNYDTTVDVASVG